MSRIMPQYAADFPAEAEVEIAGFTEETSDVIYANMQGRA